MKKISKKNTFVILLLSVAWFAQAQHKLAGDKALHKGKKGIKYKERYAIQIDLSKLDNIASYTDHKKMPLEMSIEERDEIYSRLADEFPAGTDFAVWVAQYEAGNVASMEIALPKGASDINFEGIDFVLSAGAVKYDGFYLGDPDRELNYFERNWSWTKKTGLAAIKKALKTGSPDVQTTVIFRDKHDSSLGKENPYHEVIYYLSGGDDRAFVDIDNYTDTVRYTTNIRQDQLTYLKENELVANVVPNLPEPKKN